MAKRKKATPEFITFEVLTFLEMHDQLPLWLVARLWNVPMEWLQELLRNEMVEPFRSFFREQPPCVKSELSMSAELKLRTVVSPDPSDHLAEYEWRRVSESEFTAFRGLSK